MSAGLAREEGGRRCGLRQAVALGLLLAPMLVPAMARAQFVPSYFPTGIPGYDQSLGVTVVTRLRPLYAEPGVRVGSFMVRADLDQSVGYNSNVLGVAGGPGSAVLETAPSLAVQSDWNRNALGISVSADDLRYLDTPQQNALSWTAGIGGSYTLGRGSLSLAYSHSEAYQSPTSIGAPTTATPIPFTSDDFRANWVIDLGRIKVTPNFEFTLYRYGSAEVIDQPSNQSFRDADVTQGGASFSYELSDQRSLLLVLQGIDSDYINREPGTPSLSSTSGLVLAGIDYQYDGLWRYQLLGGLEVRSFAASEFHTRVAPVAQATAIWTPTGLTTVTGRLLRSLDEPSTVGTSGFTYDSAELRVDHELLRDVLLNGEIGVRAAEYAQAGGTQVQYYASTGVTWLLNRRMSVNGQYTFTRQTASNSGAASPSATGFNADYNQNLLMVTLHVGL